MNKFIQDKKIKEIDKFLYESYKKVNMYKYLTPTNLLEENSKFLEKYGAGVEYNPTYLYKDIKDFDVNTILNEIFKYRDELNKINIENDYNELLKREIRMLEDLENMIYLSNSIGNEDNNVEIYSKKIYGEPDMKLIEKAKMILDKDYKDREIYSHNAKEVKELFEQILKEIDLKWKINVNKVQSSKISVIPEEKVININEKVMFSDNDLKRLAVHEIGTHVLRAEYGSNQPYKMFSIECGSALYTEEGLATINEEEYNVLDKKTFRLYAGRVVAVSECMNKSFYDVFKLLINYFNPEEALSIVSRIKRGIKYTKNPNAFVKDYIYLDGYNKVKKFLETHEKKNLYTGITGLNEIDEINSLVKKGIIKQGDVLNIDRVMQHFV